MRDDAGAKRHHASTGCWVGSWRNVAIEFFEGEVSIEDIDHAAACSRAILEKHPEGMVALAIITAKALPRLPDPVRKRAESVTRGLADHIRANVQVVEGEGFAGAGIRAILSGINLWNPARGRIFATVPAAAGWLGSQRELGVEADRLVEVVEAARRAWRAGHG